MKRSRIAKPETRVRRDTDFSPLGWVRALRHAGNSSSSAVGSGQRYRVKSVPSRYEQTR